jgi:ribosomal protein L11 methyltransferase
LQKDVLNRELASSQGSGSHLGLVSSWWDLSLRVPLEQEDLVYWRLDTFGCQGMTSERRGDSVLIHAYVPLSQMTLLDLSALVLRLRQDALTAGFEPPHLQWDRLESEDWSSSWKAHWQPQSIGDRLLICPAWIDLDPPENRHVLRIDPGMAFGTGGHVTTQLCLEALEMRLDASWGDPLPPTRIVDIGCGSGILSIAAVLLGAEKVFAVDTDLQAVEATRYNRDLNHVSEQIIVTQGSLEQLAGLTTEPVDGVVCNILAETILSLIPGFKGIVKETGWLILSGILLEQSKLVADVLEAHGWLVSALWKRQEWCCLNVRVS